MANNNTDNLKTFVNGTNKATEITYDLSKFTKYCTGNTLTLYLELNYDQELISALDVFNASDFGATLTYVPDIVNLEIRERE